MAQVALVPPLILTPGPNEEALVQAQVQDPGAQGILCSASGIASGTGINGILALCQPLSSSTEVPSLTPDQVRSSTLSVSVGTSAGNWSGVRIPDARVPAPGGTKWNALVVCTYFYGFPTPPTPLKEFVRFKGVFGTCGSNPVRLAALEEEEARYENQTEQREEAAGNAERHSGGRVGLVELGGTPNELAADLIRHWWLRDVNTQLLREPADHDKGWYLYRGLPVDMAHPVLGIKGRPLRATSISVAVERMSLRRKLLLPVAHVGTPLGTGRRAVSQEGGPIWPFEDYSTFGLVIFQRERLGAERVAQQVISVSRKAPTDVFVDPERPIHVAINSPRLEDLLNEGFIDLWVRVNAR